MFVLVYYALIFLFRKALLMQNIKGGRKYSIKVLVGSRNVKYLDMATNHLMKLMTWLHAVLNMIHQPRENLPVAREDLMLVWCMKESFFTVASERTKSEIKF